MFYWQNVLILSMVTICSDVLCSIAVSFKALKAKPVDLSALDM